ncbi:MAG: GNVR domain-containing protein [Candidatus Bipolaricaulaceae bacterium]
MDIGLLILPPLAKEVGGQVTGTVFSPATYKALALANDLLQEVIDTVHLEKEWGIRKPTVSDLRDQMKVEVEQLTTQAQWPGQFPLRLQVSFTGTNPVLLKRLAEVWAQRFTTRNTELFTSRAAQSYDYIKENFDQVNQELLAKEEERTRFLWENPVEILQAEVSVLQSNYQTCLGQLREKQKELSRKEALLAALQETIAKEPEHFVLERAVSAEALWNFLAQGTSPKELAALPSLTLQDQQLNSVYVQLRAQLASAQVDVKTIRDEIAYLESILVETEAALREKQAHLILVQTKLVQLDREIAVLRSAYTSLAQALQEARLAKAETGEPIRIVEAPVVPTRPIGPQRTLNLAVAGVLGLFLGVLLAFLSHALQSGPGTAPGESSLTAPPAGEKQPEEQDRRP